jgi:hypothetical protein
MTPLELLAGGVIVVLVWLSGMHAEERSRGGEDSIFGLDVVPLILGCLMCVAAIVQLLILGIKEAAK